MCIHREERSWQTQVIKLIARILEAISKKSNSIILVGEAVTHKQVNHQSYTYICR